MADMTDLKSVANIGVRIQIPPFAPNGFVTQLVRISGSYPDGRKFKSYRIYQYVNMLTIFQDMRIEKW